MESIKLAYQVTANTSGKNMLTLNHYKRRKIMNVLYAGIDISKNNFTCSIWVNEEPMELGEFVNNPFGFEALAAAIAPHQTENEYDSLQIVLESTGGYELHLLSFIQHQEWAFSLPNPKLVRDWAKGAGYRAKTDRIDGRILAHYGYERHPKRQQPVPEAIEQLDSLLQRQEDTEKLLRQEQNRQHALSYRPHAAASAVASIKRTITFLENERQQLADDIDLLLEANPELGTQSKQLFTVAGVGKKTALPLLVLCHRYQARTNGEGTGKGITAYTGLDPKPFESGNTVWKRATISKMGNSQMRSRLYLAALGGVRGKNSPLRHFYVQLVERGKAKKLALVAAARKILVWAWAIFQQGVDFDPSRLITPSN
jgi:transposase